MDIKEEEASHQENVKAMEGHDMATEDERRSRFRRKDEIYFRLNLSENLMGMIESNERRAMERREDVQACIDKMKIREENYQAWKNSVNLSEDPSRWTLSSNLVDLSRENSKNLELDYRRIREFKGLKQSLHKLGR